MIRKYRYGTPFDTEALTEKIETAEGAFPYGEISQNEGFAFTYIMDEDDIVYGLGESNRGINKRGYCYISNCTDDAIHTEDKRSLYGAHNFIVVSGKTTFGLFFDYPSKLTFDIGYTRMDTLQVSCEDADLDIYVIEGDRPQLHSAEVRFRFWTEPLGLYNKRRLPCSGKRISRESYPDRHDLHGY